MKKRLLRQLCRVLNLSNDFIRRYKRLFKALLDGSGSGSGGDGKFVPIAVLNSYDIPINIKTIVRDDTIKI